MSVRGLFATTVVAMMVAGSANASVNLVKDGSFTAAPDPGLFATYDADGNYAGDKFGSWQVTNGNVDLIGTYWNPPSLGSRSVDLDGFTAGQIYQQVKFAHAGTYKLTFKLSGNPEMLTTSNAKKGVEVTIGGAGKSMVAQQDFYYTVTNPLKTAMTYDTESLIFTINPGTKLSKGLFFSSLSEDNTATGAVLGDVSITAVPEPATWALMLIGFGGLGAALRMNRRRTMTATA
jgi:hypothetical protein